MLPVDNHVDNLKKKFKLKIERKGTMNTEEKSTYKSSKQVQHRDLPCDHLLKPQGTVKAITLGDSFCYLVAPSQAMQTLFKIFSRTTI